MCHYFNILRVHEPVAHMRPQSFGYILQNNLINKMINHPGSSRLSFRIHHAYKLTTRDTLVTSNVFFALTVAESPVYRFSIGLHFGVLIQELHQLISPAVHLPPFATGYPNTTFLSDVQEWYTLPVSVFPNTTRVYLRCD